MDIREYHVRVRQIIDKENSFVADDLAPAHIDLALNAAEYIELERRYGALNNAQESFDSTAKRRAELANLHVFSPSSTEPGITPAVGLDFYGTYYTVDLSEAAKPVWVLTGLNALVTKANCPDKVIGVTEVERDDLNEIMINPMSKPSYNWRRVPAILASSGSGESNQGRVYIYTGGDFSVSLVYPSYIHFPTPVFFGGYDSLDGLYTSASSPVSSELPEGLQHHVVKTAAELITSNLQAPDLYNLIETIRSKTEL